ncbi:MAG: 6-bladed beta-propeller [Proteobacteria bacterium]|nr:6-bladed beta-propeller [Pseudomonadota bacterium]MBU1649524.1 6-bladed beta-propeller [Pseudomonadota bacterium]
MQRTQLYFFKQLFYTLLCLLFLSACATKNVEEKVPATFYPQPPEQPRLQFLTTLSSEEDLGIIKKDGLDSFLMGPNVSFSAIGRPYDVSSSPGKIYATDRQINKIVIIDLVAKSFKTLDDNGPGILQVPAGIWVSQDDIKYIADMKRQQIVVFDANNKYVRTYGNKELFEKPVDVAVHENRIFVCDMPKNQVVVLDKDSGKTLLQIGKLGSAEGQLYKPTHITVDDQGNLFVTDAFNFRVQQFDPEGNFVRVFGFHGDQIGGMARPKGLDIDREGHLYVTDAASEYTQIFDKKAQLLLFFGGPGTGPGKLYLPAGVHIDYDNIEFFNKFADKDFKLKYLFYVCNLSGPNKINVYGFGDWTGK